jgi:hypothetical protein
MQGLAQIVYATTEVDFNSHNSSGQSVMGLSLD